jgi:DeoR/GlpR family transcriptional regulator of sugar metabolism
VSAASGAAPLIPEQRRELLVKHLRRDGVLSYRQLSVLLAVSQMTIRRDVAVLEEEGRVLATPGGAKISSRLVREPPRTEKSLQDVAEKDAMAREAASMVRESMTLYLDAGTTIQAMRPHLSAVESFTVVTNDLATVTAFLDHPGAEIISIGGRVEKDNLSTVGRLAAMTLRELSIDIAFLSSSSWDLRHGVTTPVESKIDPKRAALESASETVLVAGSSKYGQFGRYRVLGLDELDLVITDDGISEPTASGITDLGVALRLVSATAPEGRS